MSASCWSSSLSSFHQKANRRICVEPLADFTATNVGGIVARVVEPGTTVVNDGLASYRSLKNRHRAKVVGSMAAHVVLPRIHRVFSNFTRWGTSADTATNSSSVGTADNTSARHPTHFLA
jgi:ISXO2 transposase-like protein